MKKFLVFLVAIVVVICASLTTYYFVRNNEIITIKTKEIYCNAGDTIPLSSLGINIKKANVTNKTTFDYNAGGDAVTKYIKFDENTSSFVVSSVNAGDVTLVIRTSNKKYDDFKINVHIGNGSTANPYFIFNEADLNKIGSAYRLDKSYRLMNNVSVTSSFKPIGFNTTSQVWEGFNGTFDGAGYSISGLKVENSNQTDVGLFSSLGANAVVKNLIISNADISGSFTNAGILAGSSLGKIEKVAVTSSMLTNTKNASFTGAFVGNQTGNSIKMSYVDGVTINLNNNLTLLTDAVVGGFAGKISKATIQATYADDVNINATNAKYVGGYVGDFEIGTTIGSIQQSYANTTSSYAGYNAFAGNISKDAAFALSNANMLRYLIGNFAIVHAKNTSGNIVDTDMVGSFDKNLFKQPVSGTSVFDNSFINQYMVRGYTTVGDAMRVQQHIFYAVSATNYVYWDSLYVWNINGNSLPKLKMGSIYPANPSGEYFRKDQTQVIIPDSADAVSEVFKTNIDNISYTLSGDATLPNSYTPIDIKNSTFDGNGKTITINLNKVNANKLGLFATVDNSTIKNLNVVVVGVSANATNAGALAGDIISNDTLSTSKIENVVVTFKNFSTPTITYFGGIAGIVEKATIEDCEVKNLNMGSTANVSYAGGLVAILKSTGVISNSKVTNATIIADDRIAGVVADNKGHITNVSGNANVKLTKNTKQAMVAGVAADNYGVVDGANFSVYVDVQNAGENVKVGGISAANYGEISNSTIKGTGIKTNVSSNVVLDIGGIAAVNYGKILTCNNAMTTVGTFYLGANHYVGGVAARNSGTIQKVLMQSDLNGNYVAGVVVEMIHSNAKVDEVAVGAYAYNVERGLKANKILGDKYVAGAVVIFKEGKISNLQLVSTINGQTNETRSSLITLIFPYGATMTQVTVDSSFSGYGETYREVWADFAAYPNKKEFGYSAGETGDSRFNLYTNDTHHGIMQHVVINTSNNGVSSAKASMGSAFAWGTDYQDTKDSSFIKTVDGFSDVTQFQGKFKFVCAISAWFKIKHTAERTLNFSVYSIWTSENGIKLDFFKTMQQR